MSTVSATPPPATGLSLTPKVASEREKLSGAAKQFEAIFIRQMLSSARAANFGGDTGGASLGSSITRYTALQKNVSEKSTDLASKQEDMRQRLVSRFAVMDNRVSGSQSTLTFLKAQISAWNSTGNN